jgi:arylsulfatase
MHKLSKLKIFSGVLFCTPLFLAGGVIFEADFNSASQFNADEPVLHEGFVADGFSVSPFTKGPGLGVLRLDDRGQEEEDEPDLWLTEPAGTNHASLADAVANGAYIEFSIRAEQPTRLSAMEFNLRGHGNTLNGFATLRSSLDGFKTDLATATGPLNRKTVQHVNLDALEAFREVTEVTFRFYLYDEYQGQNNRRIGIDDVIVYRYPAGLDSSSRGRVKSTGSQSSDQRSAMTPGSEAVAYPMAQAPEGAPNIVLVMLDDMGFSDIGSYGGEIETPVLDKLAGQGLRLTRFSVTPKCHSSRISLLTGLWSEQAGSFGMRHGVTIAEILRANGYATMMTGKWHLNRRPTDRGFERYFGHLSGASDFIEGNDSYLLDEEPFNDFGETADEFYLTDANTEFGIKFLDQLRAQEDTRPFFLYLAYNAPHSPLQAPEALVRKYLGRYMDGWEAIQAARFERQKELGLFPQDLELPPWPEHHRRWQDLTPLEKEWEDYRMAIYAAMMESLDLNMGRLMAELKKMGEWENTIFLFLSDNGANAFERSAGLRVLPWHPGCRMNVGIEWAGVSNTPWLWYKQNAFGGGVASPLIIHWPAGLQSTGWNDAPSHIVDIYPTLLDIIGIDYPPSFGEQDTVPLVGESLKPVMLGDSFTRTQPIWYNFRNNAALRQDGWKLISFKNGPWQLFDIEDDPLETTDLAHLHPERVEAMGELWYHIAENVNQAPIRQWTPRKEQPIPWGVHAKFDGDNWRPAGPLRIELPPEWPDYRPPVYTD